MKRIWLCLGFAVLAFSLVPRALPAQAQDPKYQAALEEASTLERHRQYFFAVEALKKANKMAGGKDVPVLIRMFDLQIKTGAFRDAVGTANVISETATTSRARAAAATRRGEALYLEAGEKNKGELLQAADSSFRDAIRENPADPTAHYLDGEVLARLGQLDNAREQFHACASCLSPGDPMYLRAQHFAENPVLATEKKAPAFEVTALDGSHFNLDAMNGRVVLLDFWATWCGPCNRELPNLQKIARDFAGQPLVILSISWDSDEAKWRDFISKHGMTWAQYRDADHALSNRFGINAIPHYFTIDSDGVLTSEMLGEDHDVEGKLRKLIARAKAAPAGTPQQTSGAAALATASSPLAP